MKNNSPVKKSVDTVRVKNDSEDHNFLYFNYHFTFEHGRTQDIHIRLDMLTLHYLPKERLSVTDWTRVEYYRCENCPLDSEKQGLVRWHSV